MPNQNQNKKEITEVTNCIGHCEHNHYHSTPPPKSSWEVEFQELFMYDRGNYLEFDILKSGNVGVLIEFIQNLLTCQREKVLKEPLNKPILLTENEVRKMSNSSPEKWEECNCKKAGYKMCCLSCELTNKCSCGTEPKSEIGVSTMTFNNGGANDKGYHEGLILSSHNMVKDFTRDDLKLFISELLSTQREEILNEFLEWLEKTKDNNSAFMYIKNEKGEIDDWTLPASEVKQKVTDLLNNKE